MNQPLPRFENPPVVEVALSVQFDRLNLSMAQLGLVWQKFRDRFPVVQEKPEIDSVIESFGPRKKVASDVRFEVRAVSAPRLWFVDKSGNELIQVQRNRFVRNWRKTPGTPEYPSYDRLREDFVADWERFEVFVTDECNATLVPNQCEVSYVNSVENANPGQLKGVLALMSGACSDAYLDDPEDTELTLRYQLKNKSEPPWGRLHITAASAIRATDEQPVVRLSLTARGAPPTQDTAGVMKALDAGHESVVRGFASITTPEMHDVWKRKA
jgi:uncharacterized protein (TIGR04255 family)